MKIRCRDCFYFHDGHDGEYGGGSYYCECGNALIEHSERRHSLGEFCFFPYSPAPGCFVPNDLFLPDHFFTGTIEDCDGDFYKWLSTAKEWSGEPIDLVGKSDAVDEAIDAVV